MQIGTEGTRTAKPAATGWYSIYTAAMLERDRGKTRRQIERAQKAIQDRAVELRVASNNSQEVHDLSYASTHLEILLRCLGNENEGLLWD